MNAHDLVDALDVALLGRAGAESHWTGGNVVAQGRDGGEGYCKLLALDDDVDVLRRAGRAVDRHRNTTANRVRDVCTAQRCRDRMQLVDDVHVIERIPDGALSPTSGIARGAGPSPLRDTRRDHRQPARETPPDTECRPTSYCTERSLRCR